MSTQDHSTIIFPRSIVDRFQEDIAQAHLSLNVLIELLRSNSDSERHCLAHLLSYIELSLQKSDDVISGFLTQ